MLNPNTGKEGGTMWIELSRYQADAERKDAEAEAKLRWEVMPLEKAYPYFRCEPPDCIQLPYNGLPLSSGD